MRISLIPKLASILALSMILLIPSNSLHSAQKKYKGLYPAKLQKGLNELNAIRFTGNKAFTDDDIYNNISSRPTARNTIHQILQYYTENLDRIKNIGRVLPPMLIPAIKGTIKKMSHEIQYFEERRAGDDAAQIADFYNQNGYHNAKVTYDFLPDSSKRQNDLVFIIEENRVSLLSKVTILGIDTIAPDVLTEIRKQNVVKTGKPFSENQILSQTGIIYQILRDNGYYFASFETPIVTRDTVYFLDSVTIVFKPGSRQKIGDIFYIDNLKNQKIVVKTLKEKLCEFKTGDWYSSTKIEKTRNNLFSLGTFDIVSIDTSTEFSPYSDTSLAQRIFTQYRKQQEAGFGVYINQSAIQKLNNLGFELSYLNRNLWGIAQSVNIFARIEAIDISNAIKNYNQSEFDVQFGVTYAQPLLWIIDQAKVGLSSQLLYTRSKINLNQQLELSTFSWLLRFPAKLPSWTYFNQFSIDFLVELQMPIALDSAKSKALAQDTTEAGKNKILESFKTYDILDRYISNHPFQPTAFIVSFSAIGDTRNDIFAPTSGYYTALSMDFGIGFAISKGMPLLRPQITHYWFTSLNESTVFALKARAGVIIREDRNDTYIPLERQFFAGGANSVRGWKSRRLRFPQPLAKDFPRGALDFAQDYTGSRAILEGTFEVRWRLGRPRSISNIVADIAEKLVIVGFVDWGNTYHWIAKDTAYSWNDYFKSIAVASGLGIGILTPVGPLRLDVAWPFYDPSKERPLKLGNYEFNIGLGYAF